MKPKIDPNLIVLHCPKCFRLRTHYCRVSAGKEVYTCQTCGNVQSYNAQPVGAAR